MAAICWYSSLGLCLRMRGRQGPPSRRSVSPECVPSPTRQLRNHPLPVNISTDWCHSADLTMTFRWPTARIVSEQRSVSLFETQVPPLRLVQLLEDDLQEEEGTLSGGSGLHPTIGRLPTLPKSSLATFVKTSYDIEWGFPRKHMISKFLWKRYL